jgi:circadian clock protein KaiC
MSPQPSRVSTGVPGLDEVLYGGLLSRRSYLLRGGPGTGKTILGMHFLTTGAAAGEATLFISLGEAEKELRQNAASLGFALDPVSILDLSPASEFFTQLQTYDIFAPAEVERDPTAQKINERVRSVSPRRVFVDGVRQFQYLTPNAFQFRKQVAAFLRFLTEQGATVLFTSESEMPDEDLQFICDGALELVAAPEGRSLRLIKYRGSDFRPGAHALRLSGSGMEVFPRLLPEDYVRPFSPDLIPFGIVEFDQMLGGGLERGTIALITGPSGVGKSTLGMQFMREAACRGERSVAYVFEESPATLLRRCESIGISVEQMRNSGALSLVQVEPLKYSADQFAHMVREEVEQRGARIVMIDSIAGYRLALRGRDLVAHLHALAKYLQNMGIAVLLINEVEAITGDFKVTEMGISYLVDTIVILRYMELQGEIHKALGVLKKRMTDHEKAFRELTITSDGVKLGGRLTGLRGILRGTPGWLEHTTEGE